MNRLEAFGGELNAFEEGVNQIKVADPLASFRQITRREFLRLAGAALAVVVLKGLPEALTTMGAGESSVQAFNSDEDRNNTIQATATAVEQKGWQKLEKEGFPEVAVNTAVSIRAFDGLDESWSGSGTVMFTKDLNNQLYWVVLTAGHLFFEDGTLPRGPQRIELGRKSLPRAGQESFTSSEFGVAAAYEDKLYKDTGDQAKGLDVGVIVLPDAIVRDRLNNLVERDSALTMDQIEFGGTIESGTFSAIGFPGMTNLEPTIIHKGVPGPTEFEKESGLYSILVDNALSAPGFSGGGVFWTPPNNEYDLYVGPLSKNFDFKSQIFARTVRVTKIAKLGKQGLLGLIQDAIEELNIKQGCPTNVCAYHSQCPPSDYCVNAECVSRVEFDKETGLNNPQTGEYIIDGKR